MLVKRKEKKCPVCGKVIHKTNGLYRCPFHGNYKWDWVLEKMVEVEEE